MNKPSNIRLVLAICLFAYAAWSLYTTYNDPILWMEAKARLRNPWYYVPMLAIISAWIVFALAVVRHARSKKKDLEMIKDMTKGIAEGIAKGVEETKLMQENEIPDDESISKYYKMYCKKFELDNADRWNTAEPMSWEQWKREAKGDPDSDQFFRVRWQFMIAMTSDMFTMNPQTGQSSMMRFRDYEKMVEEEE